MSDELSQFQPLSEVATAIKDGTHGTHIRVAEGVPFLSAKNITAIGTIEWDSSDDKITESEYFQLNNSFPLEAGDVLLTIVGSLGRRAIYSGERVTFQRSVAYVRPNQSKVESSFLFHWMDHPKFFAELQRRSNATAQAGLYLGELGKTSVPVVPRNEQSKIAQILDTLDAAIRRTEAIVDKLKSVLQGLLHDLLTRGTDANGELRPPQNEAPRLYKDSPLGWIPKEWDALQMRNITTLITSGSRGWATYYVETGALFLRSQNVRMGYLDFSDRQHVSPPNGGEGQRTKLNSRDLLITITGNGVGNVAHVPETWDELAFVSQHVGLVRFSEPQLSLLAMHYLVEGAPGNQQIINAQYGQSKPGLNLENLRNLFIPSPPEDERVAITERIACAYERIDIEGRFSTQLRELKQGLMNDLLTGRVHVTPLLEGFTP